MHLLTLIRCVAFSLMPSCLELFFPLLLTAARIFLFYHICKLFFLCEEDAGTGENNQERVCGFDRKGCVIELKSRCRLTRFFLHFNCILRRLSLFLCAFACSVTRARSRGLYCVFFCAFSTNYNNPWRSVSGECCRVGGGGGCIGSCEVEMWQFLGISCCWCCAGVWVAAMGQSIKVFGAFIKTSSLLQSALITDS